MLRKTTLIIFICLAVLCSCSQDKASRITQEEALPLQNIIDAVLNNDSEKYRGAFPPDYDDIISELYPVLPLSENMQFDDYDGYIKYFLKTALDIHVLNYGKNIKIEYLIDNTEAIDYKNETSMFLNYLDINVTGYDIPLDSLSGVVKTTGTLKIWGNNGSYEKNDVTYIFFCQAGKWYLHPVYYFLTF